MLTMHLGSLGVWQEYLLVHITEKERQFKYETASLPVVKENCTV